MDEFLEILRRGGINGSRNPSRRRGWTWKNLLQESLPTEYNLELLDMWHVIIERSLNLKKVEIF